VLDQSSATYEWLDAIYRQIPILSTKGCPRMSETTGASSAKSPTWFQKGLGTIARAGRGANPMSQGSANPLREIFTDLISYVIFFESNADKQPPDINNFREKILALVNAQEERAKTSRVQSEVFSEARFAVLSWVDETILNSTWPHRAQWQHLMLTYYGTLNAGEEFFRHLENLPSQANDVREIYYLCLGLGFEGRYAFGDSRRELKDMMQALYKQLSNSNGDIRQSYPRLFPEAYLKAAASSAAPSRVNRLWYVMTCLVPVILFACYWFLLRNESNRLIALIDQPASQAIPADWGKSLVEELRRKGFRAVDEPEGVRITLESLLFAVNSAELNPQAKARIDDIVETVKRYAPQRAIVIEGHASREPGVDEGRNQKLSGERASTVAESFVRAGFGREKISAHGFGSQKPVALNDTEQGRGQNRRVEIFIKK
jgi:type VI secretion system protein ImpK